MKHVFHSCGQAEIMNTKIKEKGCKSKEKAMFLLRMCKRAFHFPMPFQPFECIVLKTKSHELYSHLTPAKQQLALAAVETYRLYSFREKKEKILYSDDIYNYMKVKLNEGKL
jgi:hypothetical protein